MTNATLETGILRVLIARKGVPVSRKELCLATGANDREVRRKIEALRNAGYPVLSNPYRTGYWLAKDEGELEKFRRMIVKKCKREIETAMQMKYMSESELEQEERDGNAV